MINRNIDVNDEDDTFDLDENKADFKFERISWTIIRDMPMFQKGVCIDFHFYESAGKDPTKLIFSKNNIIFTFDIFTKDVETIYKMEIPMARQPLEFEPNENQTIIMITSPEDGIHIDLRKPKEE